MVFIQICIDTKYSPVLNIFPIIKLYRPVESRFGRFPLRPFSNYNYVVTKVLFTFKYYIVIAFIFTCPCCIEAMMT